MVSIFFQLPCQFGSLQSTMVGAFTPQKLANATNQSSAKPSPRELAKRHPTDAGVREPGSPSCCWGPP